MCTGQCSAPLMFTSWCGAPLMVHPMCMSWFSLSPIKHPLYFRVLEALHLLSTFDCSIQPCKLHPLKHPPIVHFQVQYPALHPLSISSDLFSLHVETCALKLSLNARKCNGCIFYVIV
ncbi:hypothetical protein KP509_13G046700 [Ceratopteris richardii]|uniref:Uncharacterized protein n=1 Tax=Ceratopteris richardii TaxID=49495 RepID=A0A8T2TIN4_CERRI|nr:hypothetical protein KP509_13G046700 [Ceratopteris richardii]